jgi:hypothetical protein
MLCVLDGWALLCSADGKSVVELLHCSDIQAVQAEDATIELKTGWKTQAVVCPNQETANGICRILRSICELENAVKTTEPPDYPWVIVP